MFPGLGLGVVVAGATRVTKRMLDAAAKAVAREVDPTPPGAGLLPDVTNLPAISVEVAEAVYHAAVADGVATKATTTLPTPSTTPCGTPDTTTDVAYMLG